MSMKNHFEKYWEQYSDELSALLDEISTSQNLNSEAVDEIHLSSVKFFHDSLLNLLEHHAIADPQIPGSADPTLASTLH